MPNNAPYRNTLLDIALCWKRTLQIKQMYQQVPAQTRKPTNPTIITLVEAALQQNLSESNKLWSKVAGKPFTVMGWQSWHFQPKQTTTCAYFMHPSPAHHYGRSQSKTHRVRPSCWLPNDSNLFFPSPSNRTNLFHPTQHKPSRLTRFFVEKY